MRVAAITTQIFERIDLDKCGDECNNNKHDDGQPVDRLTDRKVHAADLPPVPGVNHRRNELTLRPAIDPIDPLHCRSTGKHQACNHRQHTNFAALHRQALTEQNNDEEAHRGHDGNQIGMVEEPT